MQLDVLGTVRVRLGGEERGLGGPKPRLVLARLACSPGRPVPADELVEAVWNDDPPADPRRSLQVYVSSLRRALDGIDVEHRDGAYVLHIDTDRIDACRFADLVEQGIGLLQDDPAAAAERLREALELWRGRPFGDLGDEPALASEVARLEELRLRALEGRIDAELALGRHDGLVAELKELVDRYPLRERFREQLILALYRSGRQGEALDAYTAARDLLAEELGIDPSPSLQQLHARVLRQDPDLVARAPTTSVPELEPASPGSRRLRGYELLEEVGAGSVGVVYRAHQPSVDREVAVKVIRPELADDPGFVRRFEREAQTVARLEHLHIVPLYDHWREPGAAYLVMRWFRDGSLAKSLRRGPWSLAPAVELMAQIASALGFAHRHGVAHLDVKPANVLLDGEDNAYLSDFGIARSVGGTPTAGDELAELTAEHVGDAPLTTATDLFALGLLTFELLTGRRPDAGETPASPSARVGERPLPSVRDVRPDLPGHLDDVIEWATALDPGARPRSPERFAAALREACGETSPATFATPLPRRNPYKGLRAFEEADARDFHGREALVARLLNELGGDPAARFVALVGPSGSGKSSLIQAGLLPALREGGLPGSERWFVTTLQPGVAPVAELERALQEVATDDVRGSPSRAGDDRIVRAAERVLADDATQLLLVIDHLEQLFTPSVDDDEREAFVRGLHGAVLDSAGRLRVVVALRADYFDPALLDPDLGDLVATRTLPVPSLSDEELQHAIVAPARAAGLQPSRDLVERIVADVAHAPGALPLLQYALTELVERSADETLTLEVYEAIGGVHGALARRAEELYASLDVTGEEAVRQVFLRLVEVAADGGLTRRRVRRAEVLGLDPDGGVEHLVEAFGRHRLLTFDRDPETRDPTVEVAHEALLTAWDRLRRWIEDARDDLRLRERLDRAVEEWVTSGRRDDYLLTGSRLTDLEERVVRSRLALTEVERGLLDASRAAEEERQRQERVRREREETLERRSATRLRAVTVLSVIGALVAVGLSALAVDQRQRAEAQQQIAELQEQIAVARALAALADNELTEDPERSILLAAEAVGIARDAGGDALAAAETSLRRAIRSSHIEHRLPSGGDVSIAPDGRLATLDTDGTVTVWSPDSDESLVELDGQASSPVLADPADEHSLVTRVDGLDLSPDGSALVVADGDQRGAIRASSTGEIEVELEGRIALPSFSPDGTRVVGLLVQDVDAGFDAARTVGVWDADTGDLLLRLEGYSTNVHDLDVGPDGDTVATVSEQEGTWLWDLETGETLWQVPAGDDVPLTYSVAFHPDGERLAVTAQDGPVLLMDAATGDHVGRLTGHSTLPAGGLAFSDDGTRLVSSSQHTVRVWDVDAGEQRVVLRGHTELPHGAVFGPDGDRVVTSGPDGTTRVWDIGVEGGVELAGLPVGLESPKGLRTSFGPDGAIATVSPARTVRLLSVPGLSPVWTIDGQHPTHVVEQSADGSTVATAAVRNADAPPEDWRDQVDVWEANGGEHRHTIAGFDATLWDLALSQDGSTVAAAGTDGLVRAFDTRTGEELFSYVHDAGQAYHVDFTPDDGRLVVGAQDAGFLLDATTGEKLHDLEGIGRSVITTAVIGDDRLVAGDLSGAVRLWDLDDGSVIRTVIPADVGGHLVDVRAGTLVVADHDGLRVRELDTGERRFEVDYGEQLDQVLLDPDGRYLAAVVGSTVHLHVLDIDDLLALADERVTRSLTDDECAQFLDGPCPDRDR